MIGVYPPVCTEEEAQDRRRWGTSPGLSYAPLPGRQSGAERALN